MLLSQCPIVENRVLAPRYFLMKIKSPELARQSRPGQFVMLNTARGTDPFLRRPFSLHRISPPYVEILYQVVGKGTESLSRFRPGESLDFLGPLGNHFPPPAGKGTTVLLAGGMGIAPLLSLAEKLVRPSRKKKPAGSGESSSRRPSRTPKRILLYGAGSESDLVRVEEFTRLGMEVRTATEDGFAGTRGLATDLFKEMLASNPEAIKTVYACGPREMLEVVSQLSRGHSFSLYLSMEEMMACGVGACLGCSIPAAGGNQAYLRACKDGPVFSSRDIRFEPG